MHMFIKLVKHQLGSRIRKAKGRFLNTNLFMASWQVAMDCGLQGEVMYSDNQNTYHKDDNGTLLWTLCADTPVLLISQILWETDSIM